MYKRRLIAALDDYDTFMVVGNSYESFVLFKIIQERLPEEKTIRFSSVEQASGDCEYLFLIDVDAVANVKAQCTQRLSSFQAEFLTDAQIELRQTDWQSLRNCEKELMRLRDRGSLLKSTEDLMTYRDWLRQRVDREIGTDET